MTELKAYYQLLRIDKPIGTLLLWYPTAWALWLAKQSTPPMYILMLFILGTFIMRCAGCLINDMADRNIDLHVRRTHLRPLTSGQVTLKGALVLLFILLSIAFGILMLLPKACFNYGLASLCLTVIYPFCKRFFSAPQTVLGITFSMGIPMAYAALGTPMNSTAALLLLLNFCWILAYDTIYAMADKPDDLQINVHSTAILFGRFDKTMSMVFQAMTQLLWLVLAIRLQLSVVFYLAWGAGFVLFAHQQKVIRGDTPDYFETFKSNNYYGLLMWVALMIVTLNYK